MNKFRKKPSLSRLGFLIDQEKENACDRVHHKIILCYSERAMSALESVEKVPAIEQVWSRKLVGFS